MGQQFRRRASDKIPMADCPEPIRQLHGSIAIALEGSNTPEEAVDGILKAACDFFEAEWVCALDVDLDLGIWTPNRWYDSADGPMAETLLGEYQYTDRFIRWIEALKEKRTVFVLSLEEIRESFPEEYEYYRDLEVRSLIAVPYECGVSGFFVVKNPESNTGYANILTMLSRLVAHELNDIRTIQRLEYQVRPIDVESDRDIVIRLFGGLEIATPAGVIPSGRIQNKVAGRIITVLATRRNYSASGKELARTLYPDRDPNECTKNISKNISKFRMNYSSFFGPEHLIIMAGNEYQLNPYYNIKVDYRQFNELYKSAQRIVDEKQKKTVLQSAIGLYRGHITSDFEDDHWMVAIIQEYKRKFHESIDMICEILHKAQDYDSVHHYAAKGLNISPDNESMYLWMYHSMLKKHSHSQACQVLLAGQEHLTPDSYHDLFGKISRIVKADPDPA